MTESRGIASPRMRVGLDARLEHGLAGGVQQFVIGLASGLARLDAGSEEYLFLNAPGVDDWLRPHLGWPGSELLSAGVAGRRTIPRSTLGTVRRTLGARLPLARDTWRRLRRAVSSQPIRLEQSDGTIERAGVDVMHFTFQGGFVTDVPTIYQPWDLQHVHLPGFFSPDERRWREEAYGTFCREARVVVVASDWARRDLASHFGISPAKIAVIGVPPVMSIYPEPGLETAAQIRQRLSVPPTFIFYPAQTWAHKNHLRLLAALAAVRRRGLDVDLVCSGSQNSHYATIRAEVRRLGLDRNVHFVGFVEPQEIQALFRSAVALVFPSLFEGWGLPILEAFEIGLPVVCSNVTSLPDLVGDAALICDPTDVDSIAGAIERVCRDPALRDELVARGRRVADQYDWLTTARTYRAFYRSVGGRTVAIEDRALIDASLGAAAA